MRLFFVFYAVGPAITGFALAYTLAHPRAKDFPFAVATTFAGAALTWWTQTAGHRRLERKILPQYVAHLRLVRIAGAAPGVILPVTFYFLLQES